MLYVRCGWSRDHCEATDAYLILLIIDSESDVAAQDLRRHSYISMAEARGCPLCTVGGQRLLRTRAGLRTQTVRIQTYTYEKRLRVYDSTDRD